MKQLRCYSCIISKTSTVRHWCIKTSLDDDTTMDYYRHHNHFDCMITPYTTTSIVTSSDNNNKISSITRKKTVWERQAKSIQNTDFENSKYLDTLRLTHDPSLHIKTIEDELKGKTNKRAHYDK